MKADLHVHTSYSYDCNSKPEEVVRKALDKQIDCLAVCDHEEIKGAEMAQKAAFNLPVLIIPGIEVKSKAGDILGLNVTEIIPNGLSAKETIKKIKGAGGMAIIPHPFGWFCGFKEDLKEIALEIDGIEVFNAAIFGPGNKKALAFAQKFNLPFTAGSDAHSLDLIGQSFLEIPGENLSVKELLEQVRQRNVKICGKEANFFEKLLEHTKRNLAKIKNVGRKKRKI